MENQDKIFEEFKNAAQKAETKDFPEMEKIWSRVDAKLDTVVYKKQNNNWRKLAVAASVVIVGIIAFQFLKTEDQIMTPKNEIVVSDAKKEIVPETITEENPIVSTEENNSIIKANAEKIIKKQIETNNVIVSAGNCEDPPMDKIAEEMVVEAYSTAERSKKSAAAPLSNNTNYVLKGRVFDAMGVHSSSQDSEDDKNTKSEAPQTQNPPLIVVDGKAVITSRKKSSEKALSEINKDNVEMVYLKEPLYIINGVHYTEESLFGKNPTSPYAPLNKQEIKTIKILQDENATAIYGEKGKKGVVIITTKTGKPAEPK
jgi:TonB-dependent SusC/RagA subfamily outer membrane receptor